MLRPVLPPEDPPARRDFHFALAGVVMPFGSFVLSAALAWKSLRTPAEGPAQAAWTRRLVGLAAFDFLVLLALLALTVGKKLPHPDEAPPPRPRIGVVLDARDRGEGAEVTSVAPGSPAAQAGLREGDVVTAVDGQPVTRNADLIAATAATPPGGERSLTVLRDGAKSEVTVHPTLIPEPSPEPVPLFQPEIRGPPPRANLAPLAAAWGTTVGLLAIVALIGALRAASLHPPPALFWLDFAGTLAAAHAALVGVTLAVVRVVGGASLGGGLLGVGAGSAALLAIAALWRWRLLRSGALAVEPPAAPAPGTVLRGVAYILAGLPRVGILLAAATPLLHLPEVDPGAEIRDMLRPGAGPGGMALLFFAAVILAPIGEETLFRGVLLPWLRRFLSPDAAVWASAWIFAAGHLRYGPSVLVVVVYGLALGWARLHTGRLRAPIALHMIINGGAMAVTLLHR